MTFRFDAQGALAALRARGGAATPAIAATVAPGPARTVAGVAGVAGPAPAIRAPGGTVAGVATVAGGRPEAGTRPGLLLDAYEERAGIAEHDGGLSRAGAEDTAARALGVSDPGALCAAAAVDWAARLAAMAAAERDLTGQRSIAAARRFVAGGWAEKAAALGWTELDLFGLCPAGRWARLDRLGAAFLDFEAVEATRDFIR